MNWYQSLLKNKKIEVPKKKKYYNKKTDFDGHSFPSKGHAACYALLKLREKAGEIKILKCEDNIHLTEAKILYIADFKCLDIKTNKEFWVEFKGFETPVWRIKRRLWQFYGPGTLEIYRASRGSAVTVYLQETIKV